MASLTDQLAQIRQTAEQAEAWIRQKQFDQAGFLLSSIDVTTGRPYEPGVITELQAPRRAMFDPWSWWTYEDTIMASGFFMEAMAIRHELTGDAEALERGLAVWRVCRNVYYQSQLRGSGVFLRPYGGYDRMDAFHEPLGTDQAGPWLIGVLHLMKHADEATREEMSRIAVSTLRWYADQGYRYWYYKSMIHAWEPPLHHAASFYLPALALAANATDEPRWRRDFDHYLARQLSGGAFTLSTSFRLGSELLVLRELMGEAFTDHVTPEVLATIRREVEAELSAYEQPGMVKRAFPESVEPGFVAHAVRRHDRSQGLGFPYFDYRHAGRSYPRHEASTMVTLARLGAPGALERAADLLAVRSRVPEDFTSFLHEDYDAMPDAVHLYARSVGVTMVNWLRDAWSLRAAAEAKA